MFCLFHLFILPFLNMPRHISVAQRAQIVILKEQNFNFTHIAKILNLKNASTARSIWLNYQKTNSLESKKPSGRPKKLTGRDERVIMRKLKKDSFVTARQVQTEFNAWSCDKTVCEKTVRRLFKKKGQHGRSAAKKILLNAKTRIARLAWCRQKKHLSLDDWSSFVFSDECRFKLRSDGRVWVWREKGQRYSPKKIVSLSNDRRSVHLWGAISYNGTLSLLKAPERAKSRDYIKLMETAGIQNLRSVGLTFIDDNAPIHRSREVTNWKEENGVSILEWPAHSPELNPIENVWAYIKRQLQCMKVRFEDLERTIYEIWSQIPTSYIRKLYRSMPNRVSQCCRNKGLPIKY